MLETILAAARARAEEAKVKREKDEAESMALTSIPQAVTFTDQGAQDGESPQKRQKQGN